MTHPNPLLLQYLSEEFRIKCGREFVPCFWGHFQTDLDTTTAMGVFPLAIKQLLNSLQSQFDSLCSHPVMKSHNDLWKTLCGVLVSIVKTTVPVHFHQMMHNLVSAFCDVYWLMTGNEQPPLSCRVIDLADFTEKDLVAHWTHFTDALQQLQHLQLLDVLCTSAVVETIHKKVAGFIQEKALLDYESSILPSIELQLMKLLMTWLREMPGFLDARSVEFWESQLKYFAYKTYAEVRISKLFEIIVEFPESKPALSELKVALNHVNCWSTLVLSLSQSFKQRLLHPGASTVDIITQYFSTIRSFSILDPSGHTVEKVCKPIQKYLSTRDDTVRCIVTSLIEDSGGELTEELFAVSNDSEGMQMDDEFARWVPDPVGLLPGGSSKSQDSLDIISILVGIYGSADYFIKEYCNLLADRLLGSLSYDISHEICNLELLKKRFGEPKLHLCDVMLKDVAESRRINGSIYKHMGNVQFPVEVFILSHCFWPSFRKETLILPPEIKDVFEEYTRQYQSLKGLRTLEWKPSVGLIDLEIELGDEVKQFCVSPPRAVIALLFQDKDEWSEEDLNVKTGLSQASLRKHITFWMNQGVIKEVVSGEFVTADSYALEGKQIPITEDIEDGAPGDSLVAHQEDYENLWEYVEGMLTNLGSMPLEKLHSMLLMFAVSDESAGDVSVDDLRRLMEAKTIAGKVTYSSGLYSLPD